MNRRDTVLALLVLGTSPLAAEAQQTGKVWRIGFLGPSSPAAIAKRVKALRDGLRELGYVEGKNLVIEFRWAESKYELLAELAEDLVRLNVDLIVTYSTPGVLAAKRTTTTIPIVIAEQGDAVATGAVVSLARPGGNITGQTFFSLQLHAKRIELLKEVLPQMKRYGFLSNPGTTVMAQEAFREMGVTAKSLKVELQAFDVSRPEELQNVIAGMTKKGVAAIGVQGDPMLTANATTVASIAARHKIAAIGDPAFADAGGLMGYGPDLSALFHRSAVYVDKILRGAKPADLPVEQATKFDLIVNLKTAKALGIKFPQSILQRADRAIE